jgi:hypothetical protein
VNAVQKDAAIQHYVNKKILIVQQAEINLGLLTVYGVGQTLTTFSTELQPFVNRIKIYKL